MINLPYNEILNMITSKTKMSEEEVTAKVNEKLNQLSGLISKEGAAHIIANELGVQLMPAQGESLKINKIVSGMRSVETLGKVQQKYDVREFNSVRGPGKVGALLMGDETGVIRVVFWNDQIDIFEKLSQGDVLKIEGAHSRDNNGRNEIHFNSNTKYEINPKGTKIDSVVTREKAERKKINELSTSDQTVEILGTIVQVFDIRFFEVCPECNKRAKDNICPAHGAITPAYSYVSNIFIDDGTSNIRVVCFKNQLENLLGKKQDEIVQFRESPQNFESVKHELLGHIVKVTGRVVNNEMFNRLELISNLIFLDPSAKEELDRLKEENPTVSTESINTETITEAAMSQAISESMSESTEKSGSSETMAQEDDMSNLSDSIEENNSNVDESFFEGDPSDDSEDKISDSVLDGPEESNTNLNSSSEEMMTNSTSEDNSLDSIEEDVSQEISSNDELELNSTESLTDKASSESDSLESMGDELGSLDELESMEDDFSNLDDEFGETKQ